MVKGAKQYNEMYYGAKHLALYFNGIASTPGKLLVLQTHKLTTVALAVHAE